MSIAACRCHALTLAACLLVAAPANAQETPQELLDEFIHYTIIARPDLAGDYAQQLFNAISDDSELAEIIDDDRLLVERYQRALGLAQRMPDLEQISAELDRRVTEGRLALARDPQRIDRAISMLTGHQRQQLHARRLLMAAGEYAVPRLLQVIAQSQDETMRSASRDMLSDIGRLAVTPLCAALPELDNRTQRVTCSILGEIKLPQAAPYLAQLAADNQAAAATRDAAQRAFRLVGGVDDALSQQFSRLAEQYFNEAESLIAYPFEPTNNVWSYDMHFGLEAMPVPTEIYSEIMAMKSASRALQVDADNRDAVSLFVAGNLRRENELPAGADDPIFGENRYSPTFYATVFGTQTCLDVLGIGLDRLDTPLVRDAIGALAETTGGANLFSSIDGRQPLLEALQYPDRRVQYEAALTLGAALPAQRFAGDVNVVPLLGSAVRLGSENFAVVIAPAGEDRRALAGRLENLGFTIVAAGNSFEQARSEVEQSQGVDLVVIDARTAEEGILDAGEAHLSVRTAATPVLIVASVDQMPELKRAFRDDVRVKVARARIDNAAFSAALDEVMQRAAGGRMTESQAEAYAIDAILTLRDIAISGGTAYAIIDAEGPMLAALESRSGGLRLMVADILALMDSQQSQEALFDAALSASGDEQIQLLDRVAESVKRFGKRSQSRQISALLDLVANSGGETAEAAARLHGALDLEPSTAIQLIPAE